MKKKTNIKISMILALFITALFISSCDWLGGSSNPLAERATGIRGIDLMISDYPEDEVYKGDQFSYTLELENNGYATSERSKLIARSSPYFKRLNGEDVVLIENLAGKNKNPSGGYKGPFLNRFQVTDIPGGLAQHTISFAASLCYSYQTNAAVFVCGGKNDDLSAGDSQECDAIDRNSELLSGGQGAPIAVTSIEHQLIPVSDGSTHVTRFTFEIANMGDGNVYADAGGTAGLDDACSATPSSEITNTLDYQVDFGSKGRYNSKTDTRDGLSCSPRKLSFDDGSEIPKITCVQDESTAFPLGSSIGIPVRITLNYIYQEGESIPITFRNLEGN